MTTRLATRPDSPRSRPRSRRRLAYVAIADLAVSALNVRRHGPKDIAEFARHIAALGILQPLIVRKCAEGYEVVGGKRRFLAARKLYAEGLPDFDELPVIVMEAGDDADAIEASLAENIARLPMDEMDQYEAFARLIAEGRSVADIAAHFATTETIVNRRLALARLVPDIRRRYRAGEIDAKTIRLLTLASPERQRAWVKLADDPDQTQPAYWQLRQWLLGGAEIKLAHALFDPARYDGPVARDLFDDEAEGGYVTDTEQFWQLQNEAIAALKDDLEGKGWTVTLVTPAERFEPWAWQPATKADGGQAVIVVTADGAVEVKRGLIAQAQARKRARATAREQASGAGSGDAVSAAPDGAGAGEADAVTCDRAELTGPLAAYLDAVRLAAVQTALAAKPGIALRLALAHMLAPHANWTVAALTDETRGTQAGEALAALPDRAAFARHRQDAATRLGETDLGASLIGPRDWTGERTLALFEKLLTLKDAAVLRILAAVVAETLTPASPVLDALGARLAVRPDWSGEGNAAFFDLVRDREVAHALLADIAGERVAASYTTATAKLMKGIAADCLAGAGGRDKVEGWQPKWLAFPQARYTRRPLRA